MIDLLIDILLVFVGVFFSPIASAVPVLIAFSLVMAVMQVGRLPGGPGRLLTIVGCVLITVIWVAAWIGVWMLTSWACAKVEFSHAKSIQIGMMIGSGYLVFMAWAFMGGGFANGCAMADEDARRERERTNPAGRSQPAG